MISTVLMYTDVLELLSALCEKFDNVECELENSPDFSSAPYKLPITKIGSQLCMVPTTECADLQTAIKQHLNGGATLGVIEVKIACFKCLASVTAIFFDT